jgi:hypothetical protein
MPTFHERFCSVQPGSIRVKINIAPKHANEDSGPSCECRPDDVFMRFGLLHREDRTRSGIAKAAVEDGAGTLLAGIMYLVLCAG